MNSKKAHRAFFFPFPFEAAFLHFLPQTPESSLQENLHRFTDRLACKHRQRWND